MAAWLVEQTKFRLKETPASDYYQRQLPDITLTIGDSCIKPSQTIRNLGAFFDSNMSMAAHITNLSRTITFHLRNITQIIRRFIDKDTCHHAVRSLVLSGLDYRNGLLSSVPISHILRLQRLQNWAARIIFIVDRRLESSPLLKTRHWLPVKQRITYKLLSYVYKALNGLAPIYLIV